MLTSETNCQAEQFKLRPQLKKIYADFQASKAEFSERRAHLQQVLEAKKELEKQVRTLPLPLVFADHLLMLQWRNSVFHEGHH